jgi:hypothetical protein
MSICIYTKKVNSVREYSRNANHCLAIGVGVGDSWVSAPEPLLDAFINMFVVMTCISNDFAIQQALNNLKSV